MLPETRSAIFDADTRMFRDSVRRFVEREIAPVIDRWEEIGLIDRSFYLKLGEAGFLCPTAPSEYGGLGLDFRYNAVIDEEFAYAGVAASTFPLQSDLCLDYIVHYGSPTICSRFVPGMIDGSMIAAIAMTEPGAGSDLAGIRTTARRDGGHYVLSGSKTYISGGQNADLVIVAAKTRPDLGAKGISLILVENGSEGFRKGRKLDKIGQNAADTSELFFDEVRVPVANLLGEEGGGFGCMMRQLAQERLSIAIGAQAAAQRAFDEAVAFTRDRKAFGGTIFDLQNTRFTLADLSTQLQVGWAHLDWCLERHIRGELSGAEGSAAKLWHSEMQWRVTDAALQLHGGAGYMNEYPIARLWRDARVQRIYGGTSEIMKEVVARAI